MAGVPSHLFVSNIVAPLWMEDMSSYLQATDWSNLMSLDHYIGYYLKFITDNLMSPIIYNSGFGLWFHTYLL